MARSLLGRCGVPSFDHDFLVDLFRTRGELAAELLRHRGVVIDHVRADVRSIDLSQVASIEFRADAVVVLRDRKDRPVLGVIVEVQRGVDPDKLLTWPVYVAVLRAQHRCRAALLVVAPERHVARWARKTIELGHPGFNLTPLVLAFDDVPRVRERARAQRLPELAVLSTIAHPELDIAEVAIDAVSGLPEDKARLYLDVIIDALPEALRQIIEARMQSYQYKSDFARKYYGQGRDEGLQKGREEGLQEGLQEGREEGLRTAMLALARAKLGALTDHEVAAIEAMRDQRAVTDLITALGQASSVADARALLERALTR
jgi:hypothetical protein